MRKVLVVEDHPELREVLTDCVRRLGYEAVQVSDGRAAMNQLAAHAPDLVCLDVVLPESSGYDVCHFIRSTPHLKDIPVLMMSGRGLPDEGAFAEEAGADQFLVKPFSRREFEKRVKQLVAAGREGGGDGEL